MRTITATELKNNLGKYLLLGKTEDILVTKNGKPVVKLTSATNNGLERFLELEGIFKNSNNAIDDTRLERLNK